MHLVADLKQPITPLPHQWATVEFLLSNKRAFNLSSCGSGKTLPSVLSIKALYEGGAENVILVVAPLSVLGATWLEHLADFAPGVPVLDLSNNTKRRKLLEQNKDFKGVVLINPDGVKTVFHELVALRPGIVVIDELAGYYRTCTTARWKAMAALLELVRAKIWAFTGTPITKNVMDFYAQTLLVNPNKLPRKSNGRPVSYKVMRDILMTSVGPYNWVPKADAMARVHGMMQPAIRFSRADVMGDILTPIRLRKDIALTEEQTKLLQELSAAGTVKHGTGTISAKEAMAYITKATQIILGAVYDSAGRVQEVDSGPHLQALLDLQEEVEYTPIIVAVPYIEVMHKLADKLRAKGNRVAVIYGDVKPEARLAIIAEFQRGELDFLLAIPKTLSHGVTLTKSHTVCWYGPIYDLELYAQLCDRIFRFGQKDQPLIVEFCSTTVERKMYANLHGKEKFSFSFLELF